MFLTPTPSYSGAFAYCKERANVEVWPVAMTMAAEEKAFLLDPAKLDLEFDRVASVVRTDC